MPINDTFLIFFKSYYRLLYNISVFLYLNIERTSLKLHVEESFNFRKVRIYPRPCGQSNKRVL